MHRTFEDVSVGPRTAGWKASPLKVKTAARMQGSEDEVFIFLDIALCSNPLVSLFAILIHGKGNSNDETDGYLIEGAKNERMAKNEIVRRLARPGTRTFVTYTCPYFLP